MSKQINIGVGGINRKSKPFIGVGGIVKKVKAVFAGIGGQVVNLWTALYTRIAIAAKKDVSRQGGFDPIAIHWNGKVPDIIYMSVEGAGNNGYAIMGLDQDFNQLWTREYNPSSNISDRMTVIVPEGQSNCFGIWEDPRDYNGNTPYNIACWDKYGNQIWKIQNYLTITWGDTRYPSGFQLMAFNETICLLCEYYIQESRTFKYYYHFFNFQGNLIWRPEAPKYTQFAVSDRTWNFVSYSNRTTSNNTTYTIERPYTDRVTVSQMASDLSIVWSTNIDFVSLYNVDGNMTKVIIPNGDNEHIYVVVNIKRCTTCPYTLAIIKMKVDGTIVTRYDNIKTIDTETLLPVVNFDADGNIYILNPKGLRKFDKNFNEIYNFTGFDYFQDYYSTSQKTGSHINDAIMYFPFWNSVRYGTQHKWYKLLQS